MPLNNKYIKILVVAVPLAVFCLAVYFGYRMLSTGNEWVCVNGAWEEHGNPRTKMPTSGCGTLKERYVENGVLSELSGKMLKLTTDDGRELFYSLASSTTVKRTDGNTGSVSYLHNGFRVGVLTTQVKGEFFGTKEITILEEPAIIIERPKKNTEVDGSFILSGFARITEGNIKYFLKNKADTNLTEGTQLLGVKDQSGYRRFETIISFPDAEYDEGSIEVSGQAGSEEYKAIVAVRYNKNAIVESLRQDGETVASSAASIVSSTADKNISQTASSSAANSPVPSSQTLAPNTDIAATGIRIYFSKNNTGNNDCSIVYPVDRSVHFESKTMIAKAIEELLGGPTIAEKEAGYFSNINQGVMVNGVKVVNGVATVDFNEKLDEGVSGSCRTSAIRAQIMETLKFLETLKKASKISKYEISINGSTSGVLQP